ncbi:MAG: hypothetical protein L6R43_20235, partial [Planctomycetes bacterium]|nr:hypothetical protein [Planctomycetota bacterium]
MEAIVGFERVGPDDQVADTWVIWKLDRDRRRLSSLVSSAVENLTDGGEVCRLTRDGLAERRLELFRTVGLEQMEEARRRRAEVAALLRDALEEARAARRR